MKRKAFTLVELLVVISIIALLVSILMPSLNKAKELAYRMKCSTSQSAVGKGLGLYMGTYKDKMPMPYRMYFWHTNNWGSVSSTATYTGLNREEESSDTTTYCITACMWMLVREGSNPKIFVCASDGDITPQPEAEVKYTNAENQLVYCWDFSSAKNVSFSWQSMKQDIRMPGGLPIMADKTPAYTLGVAGCYQMPWADNMIELDRRRNLSQNHGNGEEINVLRVDGRVSRERRADVNDVTSPMDCIYTWFPDSHPELGRAALNLDDKSTPQGVSAYGMKWGILDSFLHGPYNQP